MKVEEKDWEEGSGSLGDGNPKVADKKVKKLKAKPVAEDKITVKQEEDDYHSKD